MVTDMKNLFKDLTKTEIMDREDMAKISGGGFGDIGHGPTGGKDLADLQDFVQSIPDLVESGDWPPDSAGGGAGPLGQI